MRGVRQLARSAWARVRRNGRGAVFNQASAIEGTGLFLRRSVRAGEEIGRLALGRSTAQGKHTLLVGSQHRLVMAPWRFLNHACRPSARLQLSSDAALLISARDLPAASELTIDYTALPENVSVTFVCRCPSCAPARSEQLGRSPAS